MGMALAMSGVLGCGFSVGWNTYAHGRPVCSALQWEFMAKSQVPAARNTLAILTLLSSIDVPISASRIRSELDLPRSTTYHLLNELVEAGFVVHIPEQQAYGLGLAAYSMASAYTTQQPLVRLASKHMKKIASFMGGSGHLSRLSGSEIVYLQEYRAEGAPSLITEKGVRLSALSTASGRVMLAQLPEVEAGAVFAASGQGGRLRDFRERLAQVRLRGWDEEVEEVSKGQASVAVALQDHLKRPAAALAVTFPFGSADDARKDKCLNMLSNAAKSLGERMYGRVG